MRKRAGNFTVNAKLIDSSFDDMLPIFEGIIVVQAELMFISDKVQYTAISNHFRELETGEAVPEYMAECTKDEDGNITVKWVEQGINKPIRKLQTIIVNGVEVKTDMFMATYTDILQLSELSSRPDYTMTWSTKTDKGIMRHQGNPVIITEGMIFNATLTGDA